MRLEELPMVMMKCLLCTISIEVGVALLLKVRKKKDILNVVLVNTLTNPIVVSIPFLCLIKIGYASYQPVFYMLELITLFVEGFIYQKVLEYKRINPYILSIILNLSSYFIGEIINKL